MNVPFFAAVAVVVIGRNEGERLRTCLAAITNRELPVVYVDSGSTDGSVELARGHGADVVTLDPVTPFTAARARNAGLDRLLDQCPDVEFVQFVDGDCELAPHWLDTAAAALRANPQAAAGLADCGSGTRKRRCTTGCATSSGTRPRSAKCEPAAVSP